MSVDYRRSVYVPRRRYDDEWDEERRRHSIGGTDDTVYEEYTNGTRNTTPTKSDKMSKEPSPFNTTIEASFLDDDVDLNSMLPTMDLQTPWRKMRSSLNNKQTSVANGNNKYNISNTFTTTNESDNYQREITNYKFQIKIFKEFIQDLIRKIGMEDDLDHNQITSQLIHNSREIEILNDNITRLTSTNDILNHEVSDQLEAIANQESLLASFNQWKESINEMVNNIVGNLINWASTDSKLALMKVLDTDNIEIKLEVINLEINKRFEATSSEVSRNKTLSMPSFDNIELEKPHIHFEQKVIDFELISNLNKLIEGLNSQLVRHSEMINEVQTQLNDELQQNNKLKSDYTRMYYLLSDKINEVESLERLLQQRNEKIKLINDGLQKNDAGVDEMVKNLKLMKVNDENEIERLKSRCLTYENQIRDRRGETDNLKRQLRDQKDKNFSSTSLQDEYNQMQNDYRDLMNKKDELVDELLESRKEINDLHKEIQKTQAELEERTEEHSKAIQSLTNQLKHEQELSKQLIATAKNTTSPSRNLSTIEQLKRDLDLAVEKQRTLRAEKVRLSYTIQSLTNDKISLTGNIRNLTDKITSLTVDKGNDEGLTKKLNILEYQFDELLNTDITHFVKLLTSFTKIADDLSLADPKFKLDILNNRSTKSLDYNTLKDYHKSIFDYFTRAVEVIVNDHVKVLLRDSSQDGVDFKAINYLNEQIRELQLRNDDLSNRLKNAENDVETSPRSALRIEELNNRWKAEREARVFENENSRKRLKELEVENARLRRELGQR